MILHLPPEPPAWIVTLLPWRLADDRQGWATRMGSTYVDGKLTLSEDDNRFIANTLRDIVPRES